MELIPIPLRPFDNKGARDPRPIHGIVDHDAASSGGGTLKNDGDTDDGVGVFKRGPTQVPNAPGKAWGI